MGDWSLPEDFVAPVWQWVIPDAGQAPLRIVQAAPPLAHCATCCCHNSTTDR